MANHDSGWHAKRVRDMALTNATNQIETLAAKVTAGRVTSAMESASTRVSRRPDWKVAVEEGLRPVSL
ncbi:hypothetical protein VTK73DRAFT_3587 [Phialemonium thermophilum]|uniref:Uncharacterized protein n=1 Tax=Phialemonium thermophilum TaxID=223376 RepID=A0ABR3VH42_9PEZI